MTRLLATVERWVPAALVLLSAGLAVAAALDHHVVRASLWAAFAVFYGWQSLRRRSGPAPAPPHVDDEWARAVLAEAGAPQGIAAVKALRTAEPRLSLVDAKQLADRVAG